MGDAVSTTVASISNFTEAADFMGAFDFIFEIFSTIVNFIVSEPLLMFGLSFGLASGLIGLIFLAVRKIGFKSHR